MQALELSWLRWLFAMMLGGIALALALYLGFYAPRVTRSREAAGGELEQYPAGIRVARGPIPVLLVLLFVGIAAYMIGYVVWVWQAGIGY